MKYVLKVNWCFLVQWNLFTQCFFTESAHWANSVIESLCPSVCLFVCLWRLERPSSGGCGDLWSKNLFLIIILGGNFVLYYFFWGKKKNAISPFLDASGNKNNGATIHIGREICSLPYAGFFLWFSYYIQIMKTNCCALSYLSFQIPKPILLYLIDSTLCSKRSFDLVTVYSPSTLPITWPKW